MTEVNICNSVDPATQVPAASRETQRCARSNMNATRSHALCAARRSRSHRLLAVAAHGGGAGHHRIGRRSSTFNLHRQGRYITQPDGASVYSWGYGCSGARRAFAPVGDRRQASATTCRSPARRSSCNQGEPVTVTLANNLPAAAGNTSILFPGFSRHDGCRARAPRRPSASDAARPRTAARSPTRSPPAPPARTRTTAAREGDLQIEMGLYGALIVLPTNGHATVLKGASRDGYSTPSGHPCHVRRARRRSRRRAAGDVDYRLAAAAYDHPSACYDREYLVQLSEMDLAIHQQAERQVLADQQTAQRCTAARRLHGRRPPSRTSPAYFMVNGRSMPDIMDPNYARPVSARSRTTATRTCTRVS